jgi:hypothetical protein
MRGTERWIVARSEASVVYFDRPVKEAYKRSFRGQFSLSARRRRFKRRKRTIKIRCSFIAVGNGPFYGSNFAVCPGAMLDDGLLSIADCHFASILNIQGAGSKY